jgi:hypothetical protein
LVLEAHPLELVFHKDKGWFPAWCASYRQALVAFVSIVMSCNTGSYICTSRAEGRVVVLAVDVLGTGIQRHTVGVVIPQ